MPVKMQWDGMDQLRREFASVPREVRAEAKVIAHDSAEAAATDLRVEYDRHRVTGTLSARVKTDHFQGDVISSVVRSSAPHSFIFDRGTADRRTRSGAFRGRMPAAKTFGPITNKHRDSMTRQLFGLLSRRGFEVTE